jgi:N-acetylneuraminic acid mutarotase
MPDAVTIRRLATQVAILPIAVLLAVTACGDLERDADTRDSDERVAGEVSSNDVWHEGPRLPQPITNNAVAAASVDGRTAVYTFLGLDSTKTWSGVTSSAYRWYVGDDAWTSIEPVPGPGRLAATAQMIGDRIYVLGGYTVAEDGSERSLPDVAVYDPAAGTWTRGADIPVPVDDAVSGIWRGRIFLVSGWHDTGNVAHVQVYDPDADRWSEASPVSGSPVFGHTGAVVGDHVAYVDGAAVVDARPRFRIDVASWLGTIDRDGEPIAWRPAAPHPGPPLYRAAGATLSTSDGGWALFVGGTDNPYNYNGIGYDGEPSSPLRQVLGFSPTQNRWVHLPPLPIATMDHRNAGVAGGRVFVVGGMLEGQAVSDRTWWAQTTDLHEAASR